MHPSSQRFVAILDELKELHLRKSKDYGCTEDPLLNIRATSDWGIPNWVGALVRLNDKVVRLQSLSKNKQLYNESAEDSMRDIASYAVIALVLYEEEHAAKSVAQPDGHPGLSSDRLLSLGGPGDVTRIPDLPKAIRSVLRGTDQMVCSTQQKTSG